MRTAWAAQPKPPKLHQANARTPLKHSASRFKSNFRRPEWRFRRHFPHTETKLYLRNAAVPRRFERCSHVAWRRLDSLAGHVRFELRNVDANYPFERSHRFAGIQPNSGFGDYSRLSCGVGDTQLGRRPGSRQGCLRGRHQPSSRGCRERSTG